jgi:hypothetical protein
VINVYVSKKKLIIPALSSDASVIGIKAKIEKKS